MKIENNICDIVLLSLLLCCSGTASRASFGEKCSKELRCDSRSFLTCSNESVCTCLMPDTMTYDETSGKCVTLAGERCQFTTVEGERSWNDEVLCISNATCTNGICECTPEFFELSNGTCQQKGDFGEECSSNATCSSGKHLICGPEQTCICEHNRTFSGGYCGLKVGLFCEPLDKCVWHSSCEEEYRYSGRKRCTCNNRYYFPSENGTCEPKRSFGSSCKTDIQCDTVELYICNTTTEKCDCLSGYGYHPLLKQCKTSPGSSCDRNEDCVLNAICKHWGGFNRCVCNEDAVPFEGYCFIPENKGTCDGDMSRPATEKRCLPGLVCRDSKCSCLYKDHQVYNESGSDQKCVSLLDGPCNKTSDCALNSECLPDKAGFMKCQCKQGFTPAGRHCDIAYGQKCVQGDMHSRCDRYGPLECSVRGICECSDFQIYDNSTLRCRGLVGAKCEDRVDHKLPPGGRDQQQDFCAWGALCKPFRGVITGLCACEDGRVLKEDRTCEFPLPTTTTTSNPTTESTTYKATEHDNQSMNI